MRTAEIVQVALALRYAAHRLNRRDFVGRAIVATITILGQKRGAKGESKRAKKWRYIKRGRTFILSKGFHQVGERGEKNVLWIAVTRKQNSSK